MAAALVEEEVGYLELFTSHSVEPILRIGRGIASVDRLSAEDKELAVKKFGPRSIDLTLFANYENRRRIVAHYAFTHPATVQYELQLYRLTRDLNPVTFIAERIWQTSTGKEAFTGSQASRLWAAVDLLIPMVIGGALAKVRAASVPPKRAVRPLSEPLYDLPSDGGGMMINGRYYTEHALERMAPNTPQIRAEITKRMAVRMEKLGLRPGSPAWDQCLSRALKKVDPRGVPPSVVEAEIATPGATNVKVITANRKRVVVTVIPR